MREALDIVIDAAFIGAFILGLWVVVDSIREILKGK